MKMTYKQLLDAIEGQSTMLAGVPVKIVRIAILSHKGLFVEFKVAEFIYNTTVHPAVSATRNDADGFTIGTEAQEIVIDRILETIQEEFSGLLTRTLNSEAGSDDTDVHVQSVIQTVSRRQQNI